MAFAPIVDVQRCGEVQDRVLETVLSVVCCEVLTTQENILQPTEHKSQNIQKSLKDFIVIFSEIRKEAFGLSVSAFFSMSAFYSPLSMSVLFEIWLSDTTVQQMRKKNYSKQAIF